MGYTQELLDQVSDTTAAQDEPLKEARTRLALVRKIADGFEGSLRSYQSGSLAHHTVVDPVSDGDGGLVLDRVKFPSLGPEGKGEAPKEIIASLCSLLGPEIRKTYPNAKCGTSKRGPKITFGNPLKVNGNFPNQDPSVDIVVALTRREGSGLWIPNLDKNIWEASHPEKHTELVASGPRTLVSKRRRIVRLLKAWNKQWDTPAFSSFHLTVLAYEFVKDGTSDADSLLAVLSETASRLASGKATKDPAGVSRNLKLMLSRETALDYVTKARDRLDDALSNDSDKEKVATAMSRLFRKHVDAPKSDSQARAINALRLGAPVGAAVVGLSASSASVPTTRSFGG